jgi:hypothetical protein
MPSSKISKVLTDEESAAIRTAVTTLDGLVSAFALNLTIDERKRLYKLGDRSIPFVDQALKYARDRPDFALAFANVTEFEGDYTLFTQVKDLLKLLEPVVEKLTDTYMVAGAEAFAQARSYYDAVKAAAKTDKPGADVMVAELKKRYHRKSAKTAEAPVE